jgi:hypothetical protein
MRTGTEAGNLIHGQTDRETEIVAFRNFANVTEILTSGGGQPGYLSFVLGYGLHD